MTDEASPPTKSKRGGPRLGSGRKPCTVSGILRRMAPADAEKLRAEMRVIVYTELAGLVRKAARARRGEKMSEDPARRMKATYLSQAELASLREQLTKTDSKNTKSRNGKLVAIGRRPWDSDDGHRIICLICGIQMANLAGRGTKHRNHLEGAHFLTVPMYENYCEESGWGKPPVTSLYARNRGAHRRRDHPEEVKAHNQQSSKRQLTRLREDRRYARSYYAKCLARRQAKLLANLTETQKADMIPCPLCQRDGHPEYRFQTLRNHVLAFHDIALKALTREFPGASTMTPKLKVSSAAQLITAREKLFGVQRPSDWWGRSVDARIIATELLAKDYMSNKELGRRLDSSRLLKCPYGDSWESALSAPGRAANYVTEIRKWIKRPGKRAA